jgi:hypothetical protein
VLTNDGVAHCERLCRQIEADAASGTGRKDASMIVETGKPGQVPVSNATDRFRTRSAPPWIREGLRIREGLPVAPGKPKLGSG